MPAGLKIYVKQDYLLDQYSSGNKLRKLKYSFQRALENGQTKLLTFGGAYSNHLHAMAHLSARLGLAAAAYVRTDHFDPANPTLAFCQRHGMHLHLVSRSEYAGLKSSAGLGTLRASNPGTLVIPEGGAGADAARGCAEIPSEVYRQSIIPTYWVVPVGTGGTVTGVITGANSEEQILGISALKGSFQNQVVNAMLPEQREGWSINEQYHFGGFARFDETLVKFIRQFYRATRIPLDPIYTGKAMYAILDLAAKGYFPEQATLVFVHTGGLQGLAGMRQRHGIHLPGITMPGD